MSREIDGQIAERIMGWSIFESKHDYYSITIPGSEQNITTNNFYGGGRYDPDTGAKNKKEPWWMLVWDDLPYYSNEIAPAWEVVEKMGDLGWDMVLEHETQNDGSRLAKVTFAKAGKGGYTTADSAPMAICKVALVAVSCVAE